MAKIKSGGFDEKALSMLALLIGDKAANLFAKMNEEEQAVSFFYPCVERNGSRQRRLSGYRRYLPHVTTEGA